MESKEIEGKTIDDAIQNACSAFGVPREKLNIEIISEGSSGFLGMGAKKATIRASLLSFDMTLEVPDVTREVPPRPAEERTAAPPVPKPEGDRTNQRAAAEEVRPAPVKLSGEAEGAHSPEKAKRLLEGLLERMQIPSPVSVEETEEAIVLNIQGDGSGLLIGKRGQNLDAIQYIVNKAVHHSANGHKMIIIDTEDYRKRREESLVALAMRLAEKARKTKKPVTVGHMNAHDRRVIHLAMQSDQTLTTKSRGEGEYRKIVILPARRGAEGADT
ncbi:MAG: protein jag [Deltaproteobacteria bacterium]|nr:protein jag [Deltaproteobacteria bacterium]